ncbi:MAG: phosphatase PAP2 family protein [Thiobacillaceae bacterium]|jgi:undecaprenyl-diphosphatase|nr:phosphatase PAP2 family protein [Thiobacillaceae bacterium]
MSKRFADSNAVEGLSLAPSAAGGWRFLARYAAWEHRLAIRLNRPNSRRAVSAFFGAVSRLGDGLLWYALMAALLVVEGEAALPAVLAMLLSGAACTLAYKGLKAATSRPRPCQAHSVIRLTTLPLDVYSFPSGHTLHAVCFSVVAAAHYPLLAPWLAAFTLLVAASRLILGLHYLSDVLVGALIGAGVALVGLRLAASF